jgi:hypothetical protein
MTTLAEYNNNPGNIRPAKGVKYEGLLGVDDKGFGIFATPENGQKALIGDLTYKLGKRGIKTPAEFVDVYAPASEENDEDARDNYKIYIAQKLGLKSTDDPFPENAVSSLAKAVTAFEGGKWQEPSGGEKTPAKADSEPSPAGSSESQYGPTLIGAEPEERGGDDADRDMSALETGAIGSVLGGAAGSVYEAKAPVFRMAQRVGLLPGGKPITPSDAATLVEKVMTPDAQAAGARKTHGGENWQKSLTGISTPGAQMDKASLDLAKGMNQAVTGGAPGFTGGKITEGGIILNPRDAAAVDVKRQAAVARAAENEARFQQMMQNINKPNAVKQAASRVMSSAPAKGSLAGLGVGFNAQDAYNKFDQGDYTGGALSTGAATASGLSLVPKLARVMGPAAVGMTAASQVAGDLYRGDKQGAAESGLTGLAAMFPRVFGPAGALTYSRGLNEGEDEEIKRRRKMQPTISP